LASTIGGKTIVVVFKTIAIVFKTIAIVFERTRSRPILAQFKSTMAHSNRLNESDPLVISILGGGDLCRWSNSFCTGSDTGRFAKLWFLWACLAHFMMECNQEGVILSETNEPVRSRMVFDSLEVWVKCFWTFSLLEATRRTAGACCPLVAILDNVPSEQFLPDGSIAML